MPTIDSFGKTTAVVSIPCPLCANPSVVRKVKAADSTIMDWIACPIPSCTYEATFTEFRSLITAEVPLKCPNCGHKPMIRKTNNATSKYMGWLKCTGDNCQYEESFDSYMAQSN